MAHPDDIAILRDEMSAAVFEAVMHEWAQRIRECQHDVKTRRGNGNDDIQIRQEIKAGHPTKTWIPQPDKLFVKRNGLTESAE